MIKQILTKLPQIKLRGLGQATQRAIISPLKWREAKGAIQATAGRSFDVLKFNFTNRITKLLVDYKNYTSNIVMNLDIKPTDTEQQIVFKTSVVDSQLYNYNMIFTMSLDKEVKAAYKKAYMLGLKASGLTLYQKNMSFKKVSLPALDASEASWLDQTIFEKLDYLKSIVETNGKGLVKMIEFELLRFYQYGRIIGAPIYSFVYFNCDSTNSDCQDRVDISPWPREKVSDFSSCCRFKIITKTASEYRERLIDF
jgi:hypothetical protein